MSLHRCWTATPNGRWTIMDDGTPFIVYKGTTFMDPKGAFPGWKWRTTMLGEGGSEWSVVELYSDYTAGRSLSVSIPECYGVTKRLCTIRHATSGNFFTFCNEFKMDLIGRGPSTNTPFRRPECGVPERRSPRTNLLWRWKSIVRIGDAEICSEAEE